MLSAGRRAILFLAVLALPGCKSRPKAEDPPPEAAEVSIEVSENTLISEGESAQPHYSPDGQRLLFVSAKRPAHASPQVYERDLHTGLERRITFQSGNVSHPRFHPKDNVIVYSSSTDELQEAPPRLSFGPSEVPSRLPPPYADPAEIYLQSLDGLEIRRFTQRAGYDGEARFTSDGKSLIWTRAGGERSQIVTAPTAAGGPGRALAGFGFETSSFSASPDGKASAWIEWDKTYGVSRLRLKRGKQTIDVAGDMIVTKADNEFSPDSRWLLWAQKDPQTGLFGIWGYDLAQECLQHFLFPSEGDRRHPVVSPDMKTLTYTLVSRGRSRIAQVPFVQRTGPCPVPP